MFPSAFLLGLPFVANLANAIPHDAWYQDENSAAHNLFKRQSAIGTPEWYGQYPQVGPQVASTAKKEWKDALAAAIAAGKIPSDVPVATATGGNPTYPGQDPSSKAICSSTYKACRHPDDIWDGPDGTIGIGWDDGPLPESDMLYDFLKANNQSGTHFFIGINILNNPKQFTRAFSELGNPIAVHTWSHKYSTTLSNEELVGEFGWSLQIIKDSTGGRLPKYWRPPYGDSDNRVRAIAMEVFGLTTIIWNHDTEDWSLTSGGTTPAKIHDSMVTWLSGPKSPGLIILEHELSPASVQAFIDAYPLMKSNGWKLDSVTNLQGGTPWQNAQNAFSAVTPLEIAAGPDEDDDVENGSSSVAVGTASKSTSGVSASKPSSQTKTGSVTGTGTAQRIQQTAGSKQENSGATASASWTAVLAMTGLFILST